MKRRETIHSLKSEIFSVAFVQENKDLKEAEMSKQAAEHHIQAAEHHEHAARHHKEAAMSHMGIFYMQLIITRKQRNTTSNITARNRTSTMKKPASAEVDRMPQTVSS
jgi:hypothetical protein